MRLAPKLTKCAALMATTLVVTACGSSSTPSQAEVIRGLPVTSLDAGLQEFEAVCLGGKADNPDDPFLFSSDRTSQGKTICTMRARAPENVDVFQTLQQRYGPARSAGLASRLTNYPRGELFYQQGIVNGAGEGTYQLGIIRG